MGDTGTDINFIDEYDAGTNCSAKIMDLGDDHGKIVNLSDYSTSGLVSARNVFSATQTTGTIEFYVRKEAIANNLYFRIYGDSFGKRLYMYWGGDGNLRYYNGTDYNWYNATSSNNEEGEPIILGFIYKWDVINQRYLFSDTLNPRYGYWMWAYYNCTLHKPVT